MQTKRLLRAPHFISLKPNASSFHQPFFDPRITDAIIGLIGVCLASMLGAFSVCANAQSETTLPAVRVMASRPRPEDISTLSPATLLVQRNLAGDGASTTNNLDSDWVNSGHATWDAGAALGLANGLSIRGFSALPQGSSSLQFGRAYINGHPDYLWRFRRDPRTVASSSLIAGSEATLLGASSPGGALLYTSLQPAGSQSIRAGLGLNSRSKKDAFFDIERHLGAWQSRLLISNEAGSRTLEGTTERRHALLWSNRLPLRLDGAEKAIDLGTLGWELEQHHDHSPFIFGTAYVGGKFRLNQAYVDPTRSSARREHKRYALYWDRKIGQSSNLNVYAQKGKAARDETLLGFFDPRPNGTLRGYYREIDETSNQRDQGLRFQTQHRFGNAAHRLQAQWQRTEFDRDFSGPQNIGGFILQPDAPVYPTNLSSLTLSPRTTLESYNERAISLAYSLDWHAWHWRSAWRRTNYSLAASSNRSSPLATSSQGSKDIHSASLSYEWSQSQASALAYGQAFLPNRGRFANGEFLPASSSRQWEISHQWQWGESSKLHIAAFDLLQSDLAARDPAVPDAFILLGSNRSKGYELGLDTKALGLRWQANITKLKARIQTPVAATQGTYLVGQPDAHGSIKISRDFATPSPITTWLRLQGAANRPGDDKRSFRAPVYGVWSLGLSSAQSSDKAGWHWQGSLDNLFDRRYVRALSGADNVWQGPRRSLNLALQYKQ